MILRVLGKALIINSERFKKLLCAGQKTLKIFLESELILNCID